MNNIKIVICMIASLTLVNCAKEVDALKPNIGDFSTLANPRTDLGHPVAQDDCIANNVAAGIEFNVLSNDYHTGGKAIKVKSVSELQHSSGGSQAVLRNLGDGRVSYEPKVFGVGVDRFSYIIEDEYGNTAQAEVCINNVL